MHFLLLVIGPDVERQIAPYGDSAKLSSYRKGVPQDEIQSVRAKMRKRPEPEVDPDDLRSVVGWIAEADEDRTAEGVGHDHAGWYYWTTRNWKARWDYWSIGGRWDWALVARPGGAVVRPDAWCSRGAPILGARSCGTGPRRVRPRSSSFLRVRPCAAPRRSRATSTSRSCAARR